MPIWGLSIKKITCYGMGFRKEKWAKEEVRVKKKEKSSDIEKRWKGAQKHLGFTDDEMAMFRSYPNHVKAMEDAPAFAKYDMIIDITEAHNCAAGYKKGHRFVVDAEGCLITEACPSRLCASAIYAFKPLVDRMWQAFFNNSTEVLHDTVHCPDVGVRRGGAGAVTMRMRIVPRGSWKTKRRDLKGGVHDRKSNREYG